MKYEQCKPIQTRPHSVWIIEFENGEKRITIWHKDATIEDIVNFYKRREGVKFTVGQLGVGEHVITRTIQSYMDDARYVDQDMEVVI